MKSGETIKNIILIITIIAIIVVAYIVFVEKPAESTSGAVNNVIKKPSFDVVGIREVGRLKARLDNLDVDTGFFESSVFKSFVDYRTVIPSEPVGKENPFSETTRTSSEATPGK